MSLVPRLMISPSFISRLCRLSQKKTQRIVYPRCLEYTLTIDMEATVRWIGIDIQDEKKEEKRKKQKKKRDLPLILLFTGVHTSAENDRVNILNLPIYSMCTAERQKIRSVTKV